MPITLSRLRQSMRDALAYPAFRCFLLSCVLNFVIEILNQRSLAGAFVQLVTHPTVMVYNMLLILLFVSFSGLFRRQYFAMAMCALPFATLAVVNFVLQSFRSTPLSAVDFKLLLSVIHIIDVYLTPWQIVLVFLAIAAAIAGLVLLCIKSGKQALHLKSSIAMIAATVCLVAAATPLLLHMDVLSTSYSNLNKAYRNYGLPYCFLVSILDHGIDEPEEYSEDRIEDVLEGIDAGGTDDVPAGDPGLTVQPEPDDAPSDDEPPVQPEPEPEPVEPNIVFLQLESFIDVNYLSALSYSENPVPYFQELKEQYPSGFLTVPTYGAGTVNTEFEVLTGMNLDYFGAGEYPYITVLRGQTCETVAYNLREHGYTTTAIHNNTATFYDRNLVFSNLGFDRFISEEYMYDLAYTTVGWPKDVCLIPEISKALDASDGLDLVYAISVQPHGKYPTDLEAELSQPIQITAGFTEEASEQQAAYTYYINQLREVDDLLRELTAQLSAYDEPVMLVLFGDHLPNFEMEESEVQTGDLFQTEYVVWTNYELEAEDRDLNAYQLSAHTLGLIGCDTGILTRLHQNCANNDDYQADLELLEYDMLFGDMSVWGGENPYLPTSLQLGYDNIRLTDASYIGSQLYLTGANFNEWSVVYYDEVEQDTVYINRNTICITDEAPEVGTVITVRQVAEDGLVLSTTNAITVTEELLTEDEAPQTPATDDPEPGSSVYPSSGEPAAETAPPSSGSAAE